MSDSDPTAASERSLAATCSRAPPRLAVLGSAADAAARRPAPGATRAAARKVAGMNVLVFLTDQQRAVQHFPPGWTQAQHARPDPPASSTG